MAIEQMMGVTGSSKEEVSAPKIKKAFEKQVDFETLPRDEAAVRAFISEKARLLVPGTDVEKLIDHLKKTGFIVTQEKKKKESEPEIFLETRYQKLEGGLKVIEDDDLKRQLEENKFFESLREGVFKNEAELEQIYEKSLLLGKKETAEQIEETDEYYSQFAKLVKGGEEEIKKDIESFKELKKTFEKNNSQLEASKAQKAEQAKKVATIVERAIVHSVSNLEWYGEDVSIEPTSQFDDIKRGVDDVLQIRKEEADSFLGLGIDVTYRGLLSEQYRHKLFTLLKSIQDGYSTKIKYFKNHQGECMREFSVPKTILFFDTGDVKDLVNMVKNIDNSEIMDGYKNSPMKFKVLNQMLIQCEILASFAEEFQNPVFRKYQEIVSTIKELSWKNSEIKKVLDARHEDEVTKHMKYLINEFKGQYAVAA